MEQPTLVILAAGMGSRYGGLKQIDPIGDQDEVIVDFSIYDAIAAGFRKVVFIIKKENRADFEETIGKRIAPFVEVSYVYQELGCLPEGFAVPQGRAKPWGTGHAVLCCAGEIHGPFAVINADDYYGREGFKQLYRFLTKPHTGEKYAFAMVGYQLGNTLTENGYVSRGVCTQDETGKLKTIIERLKIQRQGEWAVFSDNGTTEQLPLDAVVSMNMWAFSSEILPELQQRFTAFLQEEVPQNPQKAEYFLPFVVDQLIREGKAEVTVLPSADQWYGVTYQEDRPAVQQAIRRMKEQGIYPKYLWEKR